YRCARTRRWTVPVPNVFRDEQTKLTRLHRRLAEDSIPDTAFFGDEGRGPADRIARSRCFAVTGTGTPLRQALIRRREYESPKPDCGCTRTRSCRNCAGGRARKTAYPHHVRHRLEGPSRARRIFPGPGHG